MNCQERARDENNQNYNKPIVVASTKFKNVPLSQLLIYKLNY